MTKLDLPARPSLEYLKKLAKDRLREMRAAQPGAKLADAQLALARDHGFPSWRALKAEVDRRMRTPLEELTAALAQDDPAALRALLDADPAFANARVHGSTPLHAAVAHPALVRLLLERGADPNARDEGDNALPLHFAAGGAPLESVRLLLDAGSDPHGHADAHRMDVIGWATCFRDPRRDVADLLVERGARHHVFSAIALGDDALLRRVVAEDPDALARRLSVHEQEQTALHYVVSPADGLVGGTFRTGAHYRTLALLLELGADVEATDAKGRTPLATAMLREDREAMRLLHAAGAKAPAASAPARDDAPSALAPAMSRLRPMLAVADIDASIAWYRAVGFELAASHEEEGQIGWAALSFGRVEIMLVPGPDDGREKRGVSLWIDTTRIDDLYASLQRRQMERARALLAGAEPEGPELRFTADLYTAFYGQREFGLRDPDGFELMFAQQIE